MKNISFDSLRDKIAEILESRFDRCDSFSNNHFSDAITISCYLRDEKIEASLQDINEACNELSGKEILQKRISVNHELGTTYSEFRFNKKKGDTMKDLTSIDLTEIFNDVEQVNWRDRFSEKECETLIENSYTQIAKFNILYCDLNDAEYDGDFAIGCLLCDRGFMTERGFHSHVRAKHFPQFEKIYAAAKDLKDKEEAKGIPKVHHKKAEVNGVLFSMEITRQLARDRMTVLGWDFHAVEVGNRTEAGGLVVHAFIAGDREYSEAVFHLAKDIIRKRMNEDSRDREFDQIFKRFVNLPEYDRCGVAAYIMGMMKSRMTDDDLKSFNDQVEEVKKVRADFEAEQKSKLDRQHEIIDAAEELPDLDFEKVNDRDVHALAAAEESDITKDIPTEELLPDCPLDCDELDENKQCRLTECKFKAAEEEVDVSDCCHSEDVKTVQPPLRSSVQSSPDDPYYVCGECHQKCEIETLTRKELDNG